MNFQELQADLRARGVDVSKPGFYEDPAYRAAEIGFYPYAEYVRLQPYSPEYLAFARAEIDALCHFIHKRVKLGGRLGACVDTSELMHRMLERRGVWAYTVKGGMTIHYKKGDLPDGYYWPWSLNQEIVAGHAWVAAPPYQVIDATILLEPYFDGEEKYLPERVLDEGHTKGEVEAVDIMMHDEFWTLTGEELTLESVNRRDPTLLPSIERWGVVLSDYPGCTVKYLACDVYAPGETLEEMGDRIECGTLPADLMREYLATRA